MRWINTKVEFTCDSKKQKYIEIDVQGYHYTGEVAQCGGGGESFGAGDLVSISGSLEGISHVSMSVGDVVLSANITGLPDSDVASEYLLWTYTGSFASFTSSQVSLTSSLVDSITTHSRAPNDADMWKVVCDNGRTDDILVTAGHPFLVYSGSSTGGEQGAWYFEYAEDITSNMKLLSSSLEPVDITSVTNVTSSASESFFRFDIEPFDVYFVEGILVHN